MKAIVLYESKAGYTGKYAAWLAEALGCQACALHAFDAATLGDADIVVYGGGLYAGGINGLKSFRSLLRAQKGRDLRIAVFATGASPARDEVVAEIRDRNLSAEEKESYGFFYLRGGFDYTHLNRSDRFAMNLLRLKLRLTPEKKRSGDARGMLASYKKPVDFTRKKNLRPLLSWLGVIPEAEH